MYSDTELNVRACMFGIDGGRKWNIRSGAGAFCVRRTYKSNCHTDERAS